MTTGADAIVLEPGGGRKFSIGADEVFLKGSTEHEGDGFSVVEYRGAVQPGPPMHVHHSFEECWVILEGEVEFRVADRTTIGRAGSFLLVPRGVHHTFQVRSPAKWVGIFSPARYVGLIEELGRLIPTDGPPDDDAILTLFKRYESEIVG
jgi:mannose-6-phosphate isomerase-like protein (cupin superfamily)